MVDGGGWWWRLEKPLKWGGVGQSAPSSPPTFNTSKNAQQVRTGADAPEDTVAEAVQAQTSRTQAVEPGQLGWNQERTQRLGRRRRGRDLSRMRSWLTAQRRGPLPTNLRRSRRTDFSLINPRKWLKVWVSGRDVT
ncbi:hypothetical protein Q1695_011139 [Nippostrongylus brasiliensis]|nr:hypothetical protein Q1695_011139 [Nippostrongylus brasiliensis]